MVLKLTAILVSVSPRDLCMVLAAAELRAFSSFCFYITKRKVFEVKLKSTVVLSFYFLFDISQFRLQPTLRVFGATAAQASTQQPHNCAPVVDYPSQKCNC